MPKPLLHATTAAAVSAVITDTPQAVLICGAEGSGKYYIARHIAAELLGITESMLYSHRYVMILEPVQGTISIDAVRSLQKHLQLKTIGTSKIRRIIIIRDAQAMTTEAQNAILKTLEEPPADTVLLLTTDNELSLLPTIRSRMQIIRAHRPLNDSIKAYFKQFKPEDIDSAINISGGRIGLISQLLTADSEHHAVSESIRDAKHILSLSKYDRMLLIDTYAKDRYACEALITALKVISTGALKKSLSASGSTVNTWLRIATATFDSEALLRHNPNLKLLLTDLFLNI